ncbi:MAG: SGNH/GDSL hydrolase family protein [Phycisphaerae bacterium]|jgi:lysophospholipase L1-like esterase
METLLAAGIDEQPPATAEKRFPIRNGNNMKSLFVIGDSISCYYGKHLETMLAGRFVYNRKGGTHSLADRDDGTNGVNGGDSSMVISYLNGIEKVWLEKAPDYLLLNCGLHDLSKELSTGSYQVDADTYQANLTTILNLVQKLGIILIWVRTTPVIDLFPDRIPEGAVAVRFNNDVIRYNAIADRVMGELGISVIDLYTFTVNLGPGIYSDGCVHFDEETAAKQAAFIAGKLLTL